MNRKKTFNFKEWQIRAAYDHEGKIRLNLGDLCDILKRSDLIRNGEAVKLCPSCLKILFRKNGKEAWSILPTDVQCLMRIVWKESNLPTSFLREFEAWANRLLEGEQQVRHEPDPVSFYYKESFPVTFQPVDGHIMVNTTQITMQFGKLPSEWLRLAPTDTLRRDMAKNGDTGPYEKQIFTTRGRGRGATWLEGPLAVALAKWIAPKSELADWCEQRLADLSGGNGPSPRPMTSRRFTGKSGQRSSPFTKEPLPDNLEAALGMINRLQEFIEENYAKIEFYEEFIENRDWFKSTRIADELKISPHQLHQFLFEEKICKYENRRWVVFASYKAWQCDVPYTWTNSFGKAYTFGSTKRWTQVGRECIIELWKQKHPESQI